MGGMGSGEYTREKRRKTRVEECCSIDSFSLVRTPEGEGSAYILRFSYSDDDILSVYTKRVMAGWVVWATVISRELPDADLWTTLEIVASEYAAAASADSTAVPPEVSAAHEMWCKGKPYAFPFATVYSPQVVGLETTTSGAGATCEWFTCPAYKEGASCGRRCRKLYWRDGLFACRQCHDLAYTSQRLVRADRLLRNAEKVRQEVLLGLPDEEAAKWREIPVYFPPHPPDMTLRRYDKLFYEWQDNRITAHDLKFTKMHMQADKLLQKSGVETDDMVVRRPRTPKNS